MKLRQEQELVVAGYTKGRGRRGTTLGALVLAVRESGGLRWAGNVGTGFTDEEATRLVGVLRPLVRRTSPLAETPRMPRVAKSDVVWVEPELSRTYASRSGRATAGCARRCTWRCATTRTPRRAA